MPLLNKRSLRQSAAYKSAIDAERLLKRASADFTTAKRYDVFLSHRKLDAPEVFALKQLIESQGLSVYVDWVENPELDRAHVTPATAAHLRRVMDNCNSLLYAISLNSGESKWMPWELGYSDARHGKVAIIPVSDTELVSESYQGQEFLGLYPYVSASTLLTVSMSLKVTSRGSQPVTLRSWL